MWHMMVESGFGSWMSLLLTVAGAAATVTVGRRRGRPGSVAACWAVAVLASGALGFGTGQRMVDRWVRGREVPGIVTNRPLPQRSTADVGEQLDGLSIGTREASANFMIAGLGATMLSALGGALALGRAKNEAVSPA